MKTCLSSLNNLGWNGVHCVPSNGATGTQRGHAPTFGFYKGGDEGFKKLHLEGNDCYNRCEPCLRMGIEGRRGETVKCRWVPAEGASCWMGFEVGG